MIIADGIPGAPPTVTRRTPLSLEEPFRFGMTPAVFVTAVVTIPAASAAGLKEY
jgi:uncharacterized membrane protein